MSERWQLNRAGILNVFQYDDETLHFAGGRLLLRGVNGSGKSTAMNMLLPFLLEADARRIDAAGEQTAVLRSWMLSGRDEQQPVGYLWIEFERTDHDGQTRHLVCGCGIKANRSTENVTSWWFVTDRRLGIDLALMEGRQPLGREALRSELGTHAVFAQEQRGAYRLEVRNRLFGGADLDRHLRLLHVVRNPRVGDRISTELPQYLADALPQLSEAALVDAAQPLEDLEEFRRNVENLTRTAAGLDALSTVYSAYARSELCRRADSLLELAAAADRDERSARAARREAERAEADSVAAGQAVTSLDGAVSTLDQEIRALEQSEAYQEGQALDDLRQEVARHARSVDEARTRREQVVRTLTSLGQELRAAHAELVAAHSELSDELVALSSESVAAGLGTASPPVAAVPPTGDGERDLPLPADGRPSTGGDRSLEPDLAPTRDAVATTLGEAQRRKDDIDRVRRLLADVAAAASELRDAERSVSSTEAQLAAAQERLVTARHHATKVTEDWRSGARRWTGEVLEHAAASGATHSDHDSVIDGAGLDAPDVADRLDQIDAAFNSLIDAVAEVHQRSHAGLETRHDLEVAEVGRITGELAELEGRTHPQPPRLPWQRDSEGLRFADLVDFAAEVSDPDRVGLESALEAAGLLGAELRADGALVDTEGDLVVAPGPPVPQPLSELLLVTLPDPTGDHDAAVPKRAAVQAVLDSISTSVHGPEANTATSLPHTAVGVDGSFRIGALQGRTLKETAEHIGVTARRAAIERRRAHLSEQLEQAQRQVTATEVELTTVAGHLDLDRRLRTRRPSGATLTEARQAARLAEQHHDDVGVQLVERRTERDEADRAHAARDESCRRVAEQLHLSPSTDALAEVERAVGAATDRCRAADRACRALGGSHRRWLEAAERWFAGDDDLREAEASLSRTTATHEPLAMRLATLEDSVGVRYDEILNTIARSRTELERTAAELDAARTAQVDAAKAAAGAAERALAAGHERDRSERRCVTLLPTARAALGVPGVWEAATHDPDASGEAPALPVAEDSSAGAKTLAHAIRTAIPDRPGAPVTADGVRQSLRARRDALGAGWDAEDDQPDDALPLVIRVTGPGVAAGRTPLPDAASQVRSRLDQQSGLLTAKQDQALRNLLQGLIAKEVADKLHAAGDLIGLMNDRLAGVTTSHGVGTELRWRPRGDLEPSLAAMLDLLRIVPDLRTEEQDARLMEALTERIDTARRDDPEAPYRDLIARVLDYRSWHELEVLLLRPNATPQLLSRRTALSEGEKKLVSYLPLFAAVAASCDAIAADEPAAPRFVLLDDAFAKVSEDNHARLFGLLVELDLDFIATSERLRGTHSTVPELAITEVLRDAELGVIALEHSRWNGTTREER